MVADQSYTVVVVDDTSISTGDMATVVESLGQQGIMIVPYDQPMSMRFPAMLIDLQSDAQMFRDMNSHEKDRAMWPEKRKRSRIKIPKWSHNRPKVRY